MEDSLKAVVSIPDCDHCGNERRIRSSWSKRWIRCPLCTHRKPDKSGKHLRALSQAVAKEVSPVESRRMAEELDKLLIRIEQGRTAIPNLPDHLVGTDRIMQRHAAAPSGMPSDNPDVYHRSRPPPLDPVTQEKVSDVLKAAPRGISLFVSDWYRRDVPTDVMAENRHMSRRQLIREWHDVLVYLRGQFILSEHTDLTTLVRQLP